MSSLQKRCPHSSNQDETPSNTLRRGTPRRRHATRSRGSISGCPGNTCVTRFKMKTLTFNSVLRTMIFSVEMKRSTSVLGWVSPSGACVRHEPQKSGQEKEEKDNKRKQINPSASRTRHRSSKEERECEQQLIVVVERDRAQERDI